MKIKISKYVADKIQRSKSDFRVDTFRAGGKGGQAQNKRNTGCRITDLITGLSVESRDATGYDENKKSATLKIKLKLVDYYKKEESENIVKSEICQKAIRSYKEKGDKVVDHRTGKRYSYTSILNGELDKILDDLLAGAQVDNIV